MSVRPPEVRMRLFGHVDGMCVYCVERPADHLDHIIPRSRGGASALANLAPCCTLCGESKGSLTVAEWIAVRAAELATREVERV